MNGFFFLWGGLARSFLYPGHNGLGNCDILSLVTFCPLGRYVLAVPKKEEIQYIFITDNSTGASKSI